jgi:hypothetical protein
MCCREPPREHMESERRSSPKRTREFSAMPRSGSGNWAKLSYFGFLLAGLTRRNSLSHL